MKLEPEAFLSGKTGRRNIHMFVRNLLGRARRISLRAWVSILITAYLVALAARSIFDLLMAQSASSKLHAGLLAFALVLIVPCIFRRQRLARYWAASFFAIHAVWIFANASTGLETMLVAIEIAFAIYLLLPSSAREFRSADSPPTLRRTLPLAISLLFVACFGSFLRAIGLSPFLLQTMNVVMVAVLVMVLQSRNYLRFGSVFSATPPDVPARQSATFRRACWYRAIDQYRRASEAIAEVSDCSSARILRGLIEVEREENNAGLSRLVFDAGYAPDSDARSDLRVETADRQRCARLVTRRNELIDALVHADEETIFFFNHEITATLELLSGRRFSGESRTRIADWWAQTRKTSSEGRELSWLIARLWEANCTASARQLASDSQAETWTTILDVATLLEAASGDEESLPPVVHGHAEAACLVPMLSEWAGLYLLDSTPCTERGSDSVARQILSRPRLIDSLRTIWSDYADICSVRPAGLLAILTGYRSGLFVSRRSFDDWWGTEKVQTLAYEAKLAAGLQWAAIVDWTAALDEFKAATELYPLSPSARYNCAYCLIELNKLGAAERLLSDLVRDEPDEALWWVRLGDTRRLMLDNPGALAAYRKALKLAGDAPDLLSRMVSVLVSEGREHEAQELLQDSALSEGEQGQMLEQFATTKDASWDLDEWGDDDDSPPSIH